MTGTSSRSGPLTAEMRIRVWATALLCVLIAVHSYDLATGGLVDRSGRLKAPDFLQFYTYGSLIRDGRAADLYDPQAHAEIARRRVDARMTLTGFVPDYSPAIAGLFAPLAGVPFLASLSIFTALSVGLYALAIALLLTSLKRLGRFALTITLLAAAWPTLYTVLRYGQISSLTLLLWAIAAKNGLRSRSAMAGLVLGLVAYKPNLLVVPAAIWLLSREWRALGGLIAGALAELAVDVAVAGPGPMREYVSSLVSLAAYPTAVQLYPWESHSIAGFLRLLTPAVPWAAAGLLGLTVAVALGYGVWRSTVDPRVQWAGLTLAAVAGSPHLLTYDLMLLAVPMLLVADVWLDAVDSTPRKWWWLIGVLYFAAVPGALVAKAVHLQLSTVAMVLVLWILPQRLDARRSTATGSVRSSSSPSISS
jgi:alpha-1,2-mannosyltransferase